MISSALRWGVIIGIIGFCGGFFGPMIFMPDANQGPMFGLFISGPLGFLLGLVVGAVLAVVRGDF